MSAVKPTFKLSWQEHMYLCGEKASNGRMYGRTRTIYQIAKQENETQKYWEKQVNSQHTNKKEMKKNTFVGSSKTRQLFAFRIAWMHAIRVWQWNICIHRPLMSSRGGKEWLLKAWGSKGSWQDYRHRNVVKGFYKGWYCLKYRVCCCKWLSCLKDFWQ